MKPGVARLIKFVGGSALGATMGAAIGALMAPRSGEETQAQTNAYIQHVKAEGEIARMQAEQRVADNFRAKVHDPGALTNA